MFIARIVFFKLHESPRYLVHAGRPQEAIESLQMISKFNGSELSLDLEDIDDTVPPPAAPQGNASANTGQDETQKVSATAEQGSDALRDSPPTSHYSSMSEPDVTLASHSFGAPLPSSSRPYPPRSVSEDEHAAESMLPTPRPRMASSGGRSSRRMSRRLSTASSYVESKSGPVCKVLPKWMRRSALAWIDRIAMVLAPEWLRTTVLVWAAWCAMSLGT